MAISPVQQVGMPMFGMKCVLRVPQLSILLKHHRMHHDVVEPSLCVQDISVTLCEENIMFWEVSGIGTEVIGFLSCGICHVWNTPPGYSFSGYFFLSLYPLGHPCFLSLVSASCFCLLFLSLVSESGS